MHAEPHDERAGESASERAPHACPICGKASAVATRPFCSKRCADIDLHRWLAGVYAVPASENDAETRPPPEPGDD